MKTNKKGVSPLIATVLLIAFSVALGAVVMNWGTSYVRETSEASEANSDDKVMCSTAVDIEFTEINGVKLVSYENDSSSLNVSVGIRNTGNQDIDGFYVSIIGDSSVLTNKTELESNNRLLKGYSKKILPTFSVDPTDYISLTTNKLFGVELVPYTIVNGREVTCAGKSIKLNGIDHKNS